MANKKQVVTPILKLLKSDSTLRSLVRKGMGAVSDKHKRDHFEDAVKTSFLDSLDIDAAFDRKYSKSNRWDYLLSYAPSNIVVAVEPHSAKTSEVKVVIAKKDNAKLQLRNHLVDGQQIARWLWVSSGKNGFANTEKVKFQLAQKGIDFVSPMIMVKHL